MNISLNINKQRAEYRDLSKIVDEQEFRNFIGEPLTKTKKEVMKYFNLDGGTLKSLLRKYGLANYILTPYTRNAAIEKFVKNNPGLTYEEIAKKFNTTYKKVYGYINKQNLQHLIRNVTYEERNETRIKSNLRNYGVENTTQREEVKAKIQTTVQERYGVDYITQVPEVRKKAKETLFKNYGVDNPSKSKIIRERIKQTNLKRYGFENPTQNEEVKAKIIETNLRRYGARFKPPTKKQIEKWRQTMLKRYGQIHLMKTPKAITKARETLLNNEYRESRGWFEINEDNVYIILDVEAFKVKMEEYETKPTILEFIRDTELPIRTVYNFIQANNLQDYFDSKWGSSYPETEIFEYLQEIGLSEADIILRDRAIIAPYEIDLYIPKYKVGIEFNGTYYHSTLMNKDNKRHQTKALMADEAGIVLYQIFEFDWNKLEKRKIIKSQIRNLVKKNKNVIYARQCEIREIDNKTTKQFMEDNHIQGDGNLNKQINYGLYYNNELVYMMTFGKWRRGYKGIIDYEIFRSCSILNTTVIGGASKLFKYFRKKYPKATIGTYSNLQTGDGKLYSLLGFEYSHTTKPTSFKVNRKGEVFTLFSKEYQQSRDLSSDEFYYEIYNTGSKLWILQPKEIEDNEDE